MKALSRVAVLAASLALVSCGGQHRPRNIIIIGVDTLRPDHLGCYGYHRETSPVVDRLALEGVLFENVISQSPWTSPSFGSLFTSLYPTQTGLLWVGTSMRETFPTLATILKDNGYATGAIINASVLKPEFGIDRGFEYYYTTPRKGRVADGTTRDALAWIDSVAGKPFFLFAHFYDPHEPYAAPAAYSDLFEEEYSGPIGDSFVFHDHFPDVRGTNFEPLRILDEDDWDHIRTLYDREIRFMDDAVGELLTGLDRRGLSENTLIVLLSDHGEEFFEHEGFGHGHALYGEVIRVPLIFWLPGVMPEGLRIRGQVRLIDVMPTILDVLDIETSSAMEGVNLTPLIDGQTEAQPAGTRLFASQTAYTEGMLQGPEKKSVTAYPWKIIYDTASKDEMLFNLETDPGEQDDLIAVAHEERRGFEESLFNAMFDISETWHIEMNGGGVPREFQISLKSEKGLAVGNIYLYKMVDATGRLRDIEDLVEPGRAAHELEIKGLRVADRVTLAVKADPANIQVHFDLRIDGVPAARETYLGQSLECLERMPFTQRASKPKLKARGRPESRPAAPYLLVWLTEGRYSGETGIDLSEETRKELRALGYVQ